MTGKAEPWVLTSDSKILHYPHVGSVASRKA